MLEDFTTNEKVVQRTFFIQLEMNNQESITDSLVRYVLQPQTHLHSQIIFSMFMLFTAMAVSVNEKKGKMYSTVKSSRFAARF